MYTQDSASKPLSTCGMQPGEMWLWQWGVVHLSGLACSWSWHAAAVAAAGNWVVSTNVYLSHPQWSWCGSLLVSSRTGRTFSGPDSVMAHHSLGIYYIQDSNTLQVDILDCTHVPSDDHLSVFWLACLLAVPRWFACLVCQPLLTM